MDAKDPQPRPPGSAVVQRSPARLRAGPAAQLSTAGDLALGVAARATRLGMRASARGWGIAGAAGRAASALPGAASTGRALQGVARPVVQDGRSSRERGLSLARAGLRELVEQLVPDIVDALDIDALVRRIDIDALVRRIVIDDVVSRIDIDALVQRIDIDTLVRRIVIDDVVSRIEIDALVSRIDIDRLVAHIEIDDVVSRIDVGEIARRIDFNEVVQRVDVDAIVEETELGTIVARSTSGFATAALDAARTQTAGADRRFGRAVNRVLRRREGEVPVGPPLLTGEEQAGAREDPQAEEPEQPPQPPSREPGP